MKRYYFIAGLPRSGSTLLAGILKQHPEIHASMSTTLSGLFCETQYLKSIEVLNASEDQTLRVYRGIINGYYEHIDKPIVFDTNRNWSRFIGILPRLIPYTKIIFCMRDIPSILNSFENHYFKTNVAPTYVNCDGSNNFLVRIEQIYNNIINTHYENAGYIYFSEELKKHTIFIDYDNLISNPKTVINSLYQQLNISFFDHDFNNIHHDFDEHDRNNGNIGLHKVHPTVGKTPTKWYLPPLIVQRYSKPCFWKGQ